MIGSYRNRCSTQEDSMKRRAKGTGRVYKRGGIFWIQFTIDGKRYFESSGLRIPRIAATQSIGRLPLSPRERCHVDHGKVATHARRSLPPSEQRDAGSLLLV